ncbi:exopolyphosphatase [Mucilaginibacter sp. BJC16-A38]|uniref:Ppx/GppA phosphatase family protein n=1 Tax=Mucilaginibacter phenanthrenivorans TaxID=1234842 RepID=UPI002157F0AC|nr:exopolyphosphatase [Mucilaginibacter phenanthrenivorans]MCR8557114.1 exopolyphosphatase [Mucilaginibacter phenanthrenivorans]
MNNPVAVMDLGTNTFHLLIAAQNGDGYTEIVHEQDPVKLGEGGINKGYIQPAAFERGIKSLQQYHQLILDNNVQQVRAIATSALRSATNGQEFIEKVKAETGIAIEIIDGNAEAAYIYKGVRAGGGLSSQNSLIVDIGGGSVEFIVCDDQQVKWKQSFEIGAARLMDNFHRHDPIPPESITALNFYLQDCLTDLFTATANYTIENIIGSSGVFESYAAIIETDKGNQFDLKKTRHYEFNKTELLKLIERIILSSHQQRLGNSNIIPVRVDMIVTASILTRFIIDRLGIEKVAMSTNSLKEGVLVEMQG